jgi:hypothetical protein
VLALVLLLVGSGYAAGRVHGQVGYREGYRGGYRQGHADGARSRGYAAEDPRATGQTGYDASESRHFRSAPRTPVHKVRHGRA